jgi:two-component system cell cycle response regulator DivK
MQTLKGDMVKKILIVDDNVDSRELVVKVLKNRDYQTIEAVDGEDALEKAEATRPDLILMDLSLPKLDGYEVTRRLKRQEALQDIPIVALTAHAMKGDREKALEAGCEGYISKPINVRALPDLIKTYLQGNRERIVGGEET